MERKSIKVKEWFVQKEQDKAKRYNMWFNATYADVETASGTIHMIDNAGGYNTLDVTVLGESEKAVHVTIETGMTEGSSKGWTTWIPKSVIA